LAEEKVAMYVSIIMFAKVKNAENLLDEIFPSEDNILIKKSFIAVFLCWFTYISIIPIF